MFNLYIYEKRLKEKNLQEKEKEDKKIKEELFIKKRDKLAEKFYNKTNNFLLEMIRKPIIINNGYYKKKEKKSSNSFCLFKYQTDKERIEKLLNTENQYKIENHKISKNIIKRSQSNMKMINNDKYLNDINQDNKIHEMTNINNHAFIENDIINQPSMKFKPRNDFERILDSINMNKELLIKKKYVKFNKDFQKDNEEKKLFKLNKLENNYIDNEIGRAIPYSTNNKNNSKIILEKKVKVNKMNNNKTFKDKINLSNVVKNITEKYHSKTYFNSIEQAILYNSPKGKKLFNNFNKSNRKKILKKNKRKNFNNSSSAINFFPNIIDNNLQNINGYLDTNPKSLQSLLNKNKNTKIFKKTDNKINDISLDLSCNENNKKNEIIEKIIKLNNPELDSSKSNNLNQSQKDALLILKKMSTNKSKHKVVFSSERRKSQSLLENYNGFYLAQDISNNFKKIKNGKLKKNAIIEDEKYIIINNYLYNKQNKNDLNNLGKIVLKQCHFINTKFDENGNNQLKKGKGKLMITNGLSVNEFLNKHSLPL